MDISLLVLLVVALSNIGLGIVVLLRNARSYLAVSFFAVSASLTAWAVTNYFTESAPELVQNIFFNRLAYVTGLLSAAAMMVFSYILSKKWPPSRKTVGVWVIALILMSVFSYTDAIAGKVTKLDGHLTFYVGEYILVWVLFVGTLLLNTLRNFIHIRRWGNRRERNQAFAIGIGFSITIVLGSFMNVILPALLAQNDGSASFDTAKFGPLLTVSIVFTTAYAIVKQGLFDIRKAITNSLTYVTTLLVLLSLYCLLLLYVLVPLLHTTTPSASQVLYIIFFSVVSSLTFAPLKQFFDRFSKRLLYRDSYEIDKVIDSLSGSLVGATDINKILEVGTKTVMDTIGADCSSCILTYKGRVHSSHAIASKRGLQDNSNLAKLLSRQRYGLIITDWEPASRLHASLSAKRLGAVLKIALQDDYYLFLALGDKRNGRMYNSTDSMMIEIAARNICLALESAIKYAQIRNFADTLKQKVETATSSLRLSNIELSRLNNMQADFISATSHQLKPQLTAAMGFSELLQTALVDSQVPRSELNTLQKIKKSLERIVRIVETILEPSVLNDQTLRLNVSRFSLPKLVQGEIKDLKRLAEQRNVSLEFRRKTTATAFCHGDTNRLAEVFFNLIENAIYYSEEGSNVIVSHKTTKNLHIVEIGSTGNPLSAEEQTRIFEKFYRAPSAKRVRPAGTGVGLYVAQILVNTHGGALRVRATKKAIALLCSCQSKPPALQGPGVLLISISDVSL